MAQGAVGCTGGPIIAEGYYDLEPDQEKDYVVLKLKYWRGWVSPWLSGLSVCITGLSGLENPPDLKCMISFT